jgi:dolichyl-phosphate beta-glucosyltransferase
VNEEADSVPLPFFVSDPQPEGEILTKPYLSVIIPAHNEAQRLPPSLEKFPHFLTSQAYTAEVLVVENGSSDDTLAVARAYQERMPNLHVLEERRGKGLAVRRGMLEATGDYRFMCDADLSMPIEQSTVFTL